MADSGYYARGRAGRVEGGLIGVWFGSLVYAVSYMLAGRPHTSLPVRLLSVLLLLGAPLAARIAWRGDSRVRVLVGLTYTVGYSLVLLEAWKPAGFALAVAYAVALAVVSWAWRGVGVIVGGGALLAFTGGLTAAAYGATPLEALLPSIYSLASITGAGARVVKAGYVKIAAIGGFLLLALYSLIAAENGGPWAPYALIVIDSLIRLTVVLGGLAARMGVKTYGYAEAVNTSIVMLLAGYMLSRGV
ncbi:MAG: hypothetical protein LRS48_01915 [Desulfurococcales archaeon]|nr:hypothetical protein [Desulfurococcales archaeon]